MKHVIDNCLTEAHASNGITPPPFLFFSLEWEAGGGVGVFLFLPCLLCICPVRPTEKIDKRGGGARVQLLCLLYVQFDMLVIRDWGVGGGGIRDTVGPVTLPVQCVGNTKGRRYGVPVAALVCVDCGTLCRFPLRLRESAIV